MMIDAKICQSCRNVFRKCIVYDGRRDGEFVSRRKSSQRALPRLRQRPTFVKRYSLFIHSTFGFDGPGGGEKWRRRLAHFDREMKMREPRRKLRSRAPYKFPRAGGRRATGQESIRVLGTDRRTSRRGFTPRRVTHGRVIDLRKTAAARPAPRRAYSAFRNISSCRNGDFSPFPSAAKT